MVLMLLVPRIPIASMRTKYIYIYISLPTRLRLSLFFFSSHSSHSSHSPRPAPSFPSLSYVLLLLLLSCILVPDYALRTTTRQCSRGCNAWSFDWRSSCNGSTVSGAGVRKRGSTAVCLSCKVQVSLVPMIPPPFCAIRRKGNTFPTCSVSRAVS